jgi:hypothetical protein
VRVATALRLGEEIPEGFSSFDLEQRRRLLFAIGILDTHSALDRGTIPILPSTAFRTPPLSINDADMSPPNNVPNNSSSRPTEMSHTAMIYEAMICQRKLYEFSSGTQDSWEQWPKKLELLREFEESVKSRHANISDPAEPLDTLQKISGKKILVSMQLLARRPPYRQPKGTVPPWDNFNVMEAATEVLQQHLQVAPPELQPWAWKNWVQWHALAVVLAELMVQPQSLSGNQAYSVATQSFRHYARLVADSESGLLWKPIAKLMRQVQRMRQGTRLQGTETSNDAAELHNYPVILEQHDFTSFAAQTTFDFANFDTDTNPGDPLFCNNNSQIDGQYNGTEFRADTPWLAWDSFIQDVHHSST